MHRVVVHLRRRDLLRAQFQMIRRMRVFKLLFVAIALYEAWDIHFSTLPPPWYFLVAAPVGAALIAGSCVFLTYLVVAPLMLLRLRGISGVLGEHSFEITREDLREVTVAGETRVAYGRARLVFRTGSFLFALINQRGALLFPRRAFTNAGAYDEFWKALQPLAGKKVS